MPLRIKRATAAAADLAPERARGCLLGLAVGNALGGPFDGRALQAPPFPALADGPYRELKGGGRLSLQPGQISTAGHLACLVAASLSRQRTLDPADLRQRFTAWFPHAPEVPPILRAVFEAKPAHEAARLVWLRSGRLPPDNVNLARAVPVGVFFARHDPERLSAAFEECSLTHYDPYAQLASAVVSGTVAAALTGPPKLAPVKLLQSAQTCLAKAAPLLTRKLPDLVPQIAAADQLLRQDLAAAGADDPALYGPELHLHRPASAARVTLRLAFWELAHAPSLEAALVDTVNRGGEAAVNGALVGALWGALAGPEAIPADWRQAVLESLPRVRGPLRDLYHPAQLITLHPK